MSKVCANSSVDLQQFHRRSIHLNEGNPYAGAWTVRWDDDFVAHQCGTEIVDFEGNVGNSPHDFGIRSIGPVSLPLDTKGIVCMRSRISPRARAREDWWLPALPVVVVRTARSVGKRILKRTKLAAFVHFFVQRRRFFGSFENTWDTPELALLPMKEHSRASEEK